jgi:hypothetical protein
MRPVHIMKRIAPYMLRYPKMFIDGYFARKMSFDNRYLITEIDSS